MDLGVSEAAALLRDKDNLLILTHVHPDGDTLGCAFALCRALRALDKHVRVACADPIPEKFHYLYEDMEPCAFKPDFYIAVDVADKKLLGTQFADTYGERILLCVDHHHSNTKYAQNTLLDSKAAAACEIIFRLIRALGVEMDSGMADCIYTGITTDTGCFRYANVTSATYRIAADTVDAGARSAWINKVMFETITSSYLQLERCALDGMRMLFDGQCAVITLTQQMFADCGSDESECDAISAIPRRIAGVKVGVTIRERKDGTFKASLRTHDEIDASQVARTMGGGGHARAAGCELAGPLAEALHTLEKNIAPFLAIV